MNLGSRSEADGATLTRAHSTELTTVYLCQEIAQILLSVVPTGGTGELIVEVALTADERTSRTPSFRKSSLGSEVQLAN